MFRILVQRVSIITSIKGLRLCFTSVCLSVCHFVLSARLLKKLRRDFGEIFWND